jgi:hypothetical protein
MCKWWPRNASIDALETCNGQTKFLLEIRELTVSVARCLFRKSPVLLHTHYTTISIMTLILWVWALLKRPYLCSHSRTSQYFMEPEGSLPLLQDPSTYPRPTQSTPPKIISWSSILILPTHLWLGISSGLFPSGSPTNTLLSLTGLFFFCHSFTQTCALYGYTEPNLHQIGFNVKKGETHWTGRQSCDR